MKTLLTTLATSALLLGGATAFAASTVELVVRGKIIPAACVPGLSSSGVIDHGKISANDLRADNPTLIGTHLLNMTVNCDAPVLFALHAIDNRAASAAMPSDYGLGFINDNQKLGWYTLSLLNPVAEDGVVVQPIASGDQGKTWYRESAWEPSLYMSVASMDDDTQPLPVKELRVGLEVRTSIARTDSLDLSNEVTIDGSATLEVKYL